MTTTPDPKTTREISDASIRAYAAVLIQDYAASLDYLDLAEHMADEDHIGGVHLADLDGPEIDDLQRRILDAAHSAKIVSSWPGEQPQDERDARIAQLEREVRQLRAGAPRAWSQDLRSPIGRFENFVNATRSYDSDHLGGIMRGGNAEATITLGDLRAVHARLAELEAAQAERDGDGDVRAVDRAIRILTLVWSGEAPFEDIATARAELIKHFEVPIARLDADALDACDAKGGESDG